MEINLHINELGIIPKDSAALLTSLGKCPAPHNEYVKSRVRSVPSGLEIEDLYGNPIKLFVHEEVIVVWSFGKDKSPDKGDFDDDVSVYDR